MSDHGRVKSINGIRKLRLAPNGYLTLCLSKDGKGKTHNVHKLVAIAFLDHKPNGRKIVVDHINEDKTDNRVENLQIISGRNNVSKSKVSRYKSSKNTGVSWDKPGLKWRAQIRIYGDVIYLGYYDNEQDAHLAYEKALAIYV